MGGRSPLFTQLPRRRVSLLKNSSVPFSEPRSGTENSVFWAFWTRFGTANRFGGDFFNKLISSRKLCALTTKRK